MANPSLDEMRPIREIGSSFMKTIHDIKKKKSREII